MPLQRVVSVYMTSSSGLCSSVDGNSLCFILYAFQPPTNEVVRPVARPAGGGPKFQNEIFCLWRELGGGRTWKKWTKYILSKKICLKKGHFDKIFGIWPIWGGQGPPGPLPRYGPGCLVFMGLLFYLK